MPWKLSIHRIIEWSGKDLKNLCAGLPTTRPGCLEPHLP